MHTQTGLGKQRLRFVCLDACVCPSEPLFMVLVCVAHLCVCLKDGGQPERRVPSIRLQRRKQQSARMKGPAKREGTSDSLACGVSPASPAFSGNGVSGRSHAFGSTFRPDLEL